MNDNKFKKLMSNQLFIPVIALVVLALINLINDPSFFKVTLGTNNAGNPVLSGYLITILDYGSELGILAIGMTLVTAASGGQDISVGATIAIAGSECSGFYVEAIQDPKLFRLLLLLPFWLHVLLECCAELLMVFLYLFLRYSP